MSILVRTPVVHAYMSKINTLHIVCALQGTDTPFSPRTSALRPTALSAKPLCPTQPQGNEDSVSEAAKNLDTA
jgi:hypothetical protein